MIRDGDERAEAQGKAAGTPLNPVAKSATKKTSNVRKTSRGSKPHGVRDDAVTTAAGWVVLDVSGPVTASVPLDLSVLGWSAGWRRDLERDLEPGRVVAVHRGALDLYTAAGVVRARPPGGSGFAAIDVAVGDWVGFADGAVRSVLPRRTALVRGAARRSTRPQTLVANIDLALLVDSLGTEIDIEWIERCLVAIWDSGATPEIVLTKADRIDDPRPFVERSKRSRPVCRFTSSALSRAPAASGCVAASNRQRPRCCSARVASASRPS